MLTQRMEGRNEAEIRKDSQSSDLGGLLDNGKEFRLNPMNEWRL